MRGMQNSPTQLLEVGEEAPSFSLPDQNGKVTTLEEFRGIKNVVLVFYPRDHTPGCTQQLCNIRDDFELFTAEDVVVLGVNPQDARAHRGFTDRHGFPFRLLADRDKRVVSAYGCRGILATKRTVYGIDKDGVIVFARRGAPSSDEILRAFRSSAAAEDAGSPASG